MILPDRFNEYFLLDFEEIGGKWETIEVTKRTEKYTDRFCKLSFEGIEEYTHIRFYKNGLAMIGEPFIDIKTGKKITRVDPQITTRMDSLIYNMEYKRKGSPLVNKRHDQEAFYSMGSALIWILIVVMVGLTFFRILNIPECAVSVVLLIITLVAKRAMWHEKIILIGSDVKNYYERYK